LNEASRARNVCFITLSLYRVPNMKAKWRSPACCFVRMFRFRNKKGFDKTSYRRSTMQLESQLRFCFMCVKCNPYCTLSRTLVSRSFNEPVFVQNIVATQAKYKSKKC